MRADDPARNRRPAQPGAGRLDHVPALARDAAGLLLDRPAGDFEVTVVPTLAPAEQRGLDEALAARGQLEQAERDAAQASRVIVKDLRGQGLTVCDVARL